MPPRQRRSPSVACAEDALGQWDHGYRGSGFVTPQRRRPADPETGERRRLSRNQREVNSAHARQRGPGERANAQLKAWRILRKIRCCPRRATDLVKAILVLSRPADDEFG
jgi:DDE superfamily endonuclease